MIEFLKGVFIGEPAVYVLHDGNHRDRRFQRFGKAGYQQCRRGSVLRRHNRHLTGNAGISVGHGRTGIFRAIAYLPDAVIGCGEKKGRGNALPENPRHTVAPQGGGKHMGAGGIGSWLTHAMKNPFRQKPTLT